jgi:hypothetical protein
VSSTRALLQLPASLALPRAILCSTVIPPFSGEEVSRHNGVVSMTIDVREKDASTLRRTDRAGGSILTLITTGGADRTSLVVTLAVLLSSA